MADTGVCLISFPEDPGTHSRVRKRVQRPPFPEAERVYPPAPGGNVRCRRFVTGSDNALLSVWNARERKLVRRAHVGRPVKCADFSPDGSHLALGCDDGTLIVVVYATLPPATRPAPGRESVLPPAAAPAAARQEMDASFQDTRECKLLVDLAAAMDESDVDKFTSTLAEFDSMSRLDQWKAREAPPPPPGTACGAPLRGVRSPFPCCDAD